VMIVKAALLKLLREKLGLLSHVDFIFERKFYDEDRCAKCGAREVYFRIVFEQWVHGKLISKVVIPYCRKCGFKEISVF